MRVWRDAPNLSSLAPTHGELFGTSRAFKTERLLWFPPARDRSLIGEWWWTWDIPLLLVKFSNFMHSLIDVDNYSKLK